MDRKTPQEPAWKRRRRETAEAAQRVRDLELREKTLQVEIARGSRTEKREIRNTRLNLAGVIVGAIGVVVGSIGVSTWLAEQPDREEEREVRRATLVNNAYQIIVDNVAASPNYLELTPSLQQAINTLLWYNEPVLIRAGFIDFREPVFYCGLITLDGWEGVILEDMRADSVNLIVRGKHVLIDGSDNRNATVAIQGHRGLELTGVAAVVGYFDNTNIFFMHRGVLSLSARASAVQTYDGYAFLDNFNGVLGEFGFYSMAEMMADLPPPQDRAAGEDPTRPPDFWASTRVAELLQQASSMHVLTPADPPTYLPPTDEGGAWARGVPTPQFTAACPDRHCNNGGFKPAVRKAPQQSGCMGRKLDFIHHPPYLRNRLWAYDDATRPQAPLQFDPMAPPPEASGTPQGSR